MPIVYGNNSWGKILHIGLLKNVEFVYYRDGYIEDIREIMDIQGLKKIHVIYHGWYTIIVEVINHNDIEKLYKNGFKLGIMTDRKYKSLDKNGFYKVVEL